MGGGGNNLLSALLFGGLRDPILGKYGMFGLGLGPHPGVDTTGQFGESPAGPNPGAFGGDPALDQFSNLRPGRTAGFDTYQEWLLSKGAPYNQGVRQNPFYGGAFGGGLHDDLGNPFIRGQDFGSSGHRSGLPLF
jgi:hypothetical protein